MTKKAQTLKEGQITLLQYIVDCLIPGTKEMLPASEIGTAEYLDSIAGTSVMFRRQLLEGLKDIEIAAGKTGQEFASLSEDGRIEVLKSVEVSNPGFFNQLVRYTYTVYYTTPEVLKRLGMSGRPPQPLGYHMERGNLDLIEKVKARGPVYKEV